MAEKGEKKVKKITLSVPVLGIRLVTGKTFGFARLADRGGDAFVSPPLMREIGGTVPPHAIVEMAEKGRRVIRFLGQPETKLVWEGKPDEERMIALVPEIARRWADRKEVEPSFIWSVPDTGHEEFKALWSAACRAGEAGIRFLGQWERAFKAEKCRAIALRIPRLFEAWKVALPAAVEADRARDIADIHQGSSLNIEREFRYYPWWGKYAPAGVQLRISAICAPLNAETNHLCYQARAERKAESAESSRERRLYEEAEQARQRHGVWRGLMAAGIADLVSVNEPLKTWPRAGDYFPESDHGELGALKWLRKRREREVEGIMDALCEASGIEIGRSWYEAPSYDPNYFATHDDPDNIYCGSSCGKYVGGGMRFERHRWSSEAIGRIQATDKAAGFRADLNRLVEAELHRRMEELDSETLSERNLPWAEESKLHLPESKERLRTIRAEETRLKEEAKAEELRQRGLREEEARRAAKNAEEERRLLSIASVRKGWRTMLRWVPASGGYCSLHPDARALLERIRSAQERAQELGPSNEARRERQEAERKEAEKSTFLGKGAWDQLDGLKL